MSFPTLIKEKILLKWHGDISFRKWVKRLTCPCCCCCYTLRGCVFKCTRGKKKAKQRKRNDTTSQIKKNQRIRQLQTRKRDVSIDTKGRWKKKAEPEDQQQSMLFSRLPLELRLLIYVSCLWEIGPVEVRRSKYPNDRLEFVASQALHTSLLRTCKKVYREAIGTLYSRNNFAFHSSSALVAFQERMLPQRLDQMRNITLITPTSRRLGYRPMTFRYSDMKFIYPPHKLSDVLSILSKMHNLRGVHLKYVIFEEHLQDTKAGHFELLNNFQKLSRTENYEVTYEIAILRDLDEEQELGNGPHTDVLLFGQWRVNMRITLNRKISDEIVQK